MKKRTTKTLLVAALATLSTTQISAQWVLGTNAVSALQANTIGTSSLSAVGKTSFNIITNSLQRIAVDGSSYSTFFRGVPGSQLGILNNNSGFTAVQGLKSTLCLYGFPSCITDGTGGSDIYQAARNIFMQPPVDLPGFEGASNIGRVFIGEKPFTPLSPSSTPKFLVRGGGVLEASCGPVPNPDNIGLVSEGNFAESPASPNANKWISLGSRPPSSVADFNSYGYRTQWNNYAGDLAVQNQPNIASTVKDVSLTWQDGLATVSPSLSTFTSQSGLLVQFRNGLAPGAGPAGNFRFTVARFGMQNGTGLIQLNGVFSVPVLLNPSDARLKKDIKSFTNSMDIINRLNPVTYDYKADEFGEFGLPRTLQYGFVAQELEKVLPTHVAEMNTGYKAVNYVMLIPILTKALQEVNKKVSALETTNQELVKELERKGVVTPGSSSSINNLGDQFFQNKPNPFNDVTTISYNFKTDEAYKIIVTDLTGKKVKEFANLQSSGEIQITKSDLPAAGIYLYSLITAGGEIAATKQMIFEK